MISTWLIAGPMTAALWKRTSHSIAVSLLCRDSSRIATTAGGRPTGSISFKESCTQIKSVFTKELQYQVNGGCWISLSTTVEIFKLHEDETNEQSLCLYTAACEEDPELKSFGYSLDQRFSKLKSSLAIEGKTENYPLNSVKLLCGFLVETNQELAKEITASKDVLEDEELRSLVDLYYESSTKTLDLFNTVGNSANKAKLSIVNIRMAIKQFERESMDTDLGGNKKKYEDTLEELNKVKAMGDPFGDEYKNQMKSVREEQLILLKKFHELAVKLDSKKKILKIRRRLVTIVYALAALSFLAVEICVCIAIPPMALYTALGTVTGLNYVIGTVGVLVHKVLKKGEKDLDKQKEEKILRLQLAMEKTSLKLVFLFSLTIIVFCSSLGDAREMAKEEVNYIDGKCPDGKKNCNCLPPVAPVMDSYKINATCHRDIECIKFCPKGCKIVNWVDQVLDELEAQIVDTSYKLSACKEVNYNAMEGRLAESAESLKQSRGQVSEITLQLAQLRRTLHYIRNGTSENEESAEYSGTGQDLRQKYALRPSDLRHKNALRMLEKSLSRELELEKKLMEFQQNEEQLKLKLHYTEEVSSRMEEASEFIWGRFLEAENSSEVFMGLSKELVGRLQIIQFSQSWAAQREAELKSKLEDITAQLQVKDLEVKKFEGTIQENQEIVSEVLTLREHVKLTEKKLKDTEENLFEAESRAESGETKVKELNAANLELTEELSFLKDADDKKTKKVSSLEKQLRELEFQLQNSKVLSEASQEQQNMLYSAIWDMETLIEDLKSKASKAESRTETVEEQCIVLSTTNSVLNKEVMSLRQRAKSLEASFWI
ncbi:hypothetical protein DY000_02063386 [Brassica cretica]|uniref:WIT1/2 N-terminal helical bundle domain-containing protein n=1 Tax=Brassica cretica TaxID=69181 RepID=A0ABQ7B2K4_BRACR|nr:hypothetical protein DY000_02063386 [Brassica cretica]